MNEMIKKVIDSDKEALNSLEAFTKAALNLGYSQEEIDKALEEMPLNLDELEEVAGGSWWNIGGFGPRLPKTNPYLSGRVLF